MLRIYLPENENLLEIDSLEVEIIMIKYLEWKGSYKAKLHNVEVH